MAIFAEAEAINLLNEIRYILSNEKITKVQKCDEITGLFEKTDRKIPCDKRIKACR